MSSSKTRIAAALLAGLAVAGWVGEAVARPGYRNYGGHRRGIGPGGIAAGAALGIAGAAIAGTAINRSYNGYPAYGYGPGYGARYGYDYHPSYGYYGPY